MEGEIPNEGCSVGFTCCLGVEVLDWELRLANVVSCAVCEGCVGTLYKLSGNKQQAFSTWGPWVPKQASGTVGLNCETLSRFGRIILRPD